MKGWRVVCGDIMYEDIASAERGACMHLCPDCSKAYGALVKDWLKGGQCITLVNLDGSVTTLPMPSVPEGTMRLDSFTEAEGEMTIGEREEGC